MLTPQDRELLDRKGISEDAPAPTEQELLAEIRDLLANQNGPRQL